MYKMQKTVLSALTATVIITAGYADTFDEAFKNGEVSGQVRVGYIYNNPKLSDEKTMHATAVGGQLKYETAKFYGFDAGAAFYTSHDIYALSGDKSDEKRDEELSSGKGHYSVLAESYIDYTQDAFTLRIGRQLIDTPYADSDDIRMTPNTFEAALASYTLNDFTFIGAYLTRWQGPDSESEYEFTDLAEGNGIALAAVTYGSDMLEAGVWYYGAAKTADVYYADAIAHLAVGDGIALSGGLQFADQSERNGSGIGANLYGAIAEAGTNGLSLGIAYNKVNVENGKEYFGGFGGGAAFVNMDETTAGAISLNQDVEAWKYRAAYDFTEIGLNGFILQYDYGVYDGKEHSRIYEHNVIVAYAPTETWDAEVIYAHVDDAEKDLRVDHSGHPADGTFDRVLFRTNYNF